MKIAIVDKSLMILTKKSSYWVSFNSWESFNYEKDYYDGWNYILELGFITMCWQK